MLILRARLGGLIPNRRRYTVSVFSVWTLFNLVPRAFSLFKMAVGETPGQGCWNTPRIVEYSVTWQSWSNGVCGVCFQLLAALFVFCNRKPLFKQNEDISSYLRDEILTNFWSHFGSLGQGSVSDRHFKRGEGPGDEVGHYSLPSVIYWR